MNKINVVDKTEKLKLGKYYELRGNFEKIENEEGEISYSCDMFRTTDSTKTFDELYEEELRLEIIQYLSDTNYIAINYSDLDTDEEREAFLAEVSDSYGLTNAEIRAKRKELRASL